MNHTHEYAYWHSHKHEHQGEKHDHGHYHSWVQTHDHGEKLTPHCHKDKLYHPGDEAVEHHAKEVHQLEG